MDSNAPARPGSPKVAVVTGAFSFIGRHIASDLLARGWTVRTLTNRPRPIVDFDGWRDVEVFPLDFADAGHLRAALRGADVFFNTYWVRFPHAGQGFDDAVRNTGTLVDAACEVGVRRIVHVSVSNPAVTSALGYYSGKAEAEDVVEQAPIEHAIVRPTLVFGDGDILLNNIAWLLRRFPAFAVPGDGNYRVQPVSGSDTARIAIAAALGPEGAVVDAAGPDVLSFDELVLLIARTVGSSARIVHVPPRAALVASRLIGIPVRDVMLTWEEIEGLRQEMLVSHQPPRGTDRIGAWLDSVSETLGTTYAHELNRHFGHLPVTVA